VTESSPPKAERFVEPQNRPGREKQRGVSVERARAHNRHNIAARAEATHSAKRSVGDLHTEVRRRVIGAFAEVVMIAPTPRLVSG